MKNTAYFTFPLKFLWFTNPADKVKAMQDCIDYSTYKFMESGKCGNGKPDNRLVKAREILCFTGGTAANYKNVGIRLSNTIIKGDIFTSVKASYLFEARDGALRLELLLMIAAVKSIIGHKRNFSKTNRLFILHRMYGRETAVTRYQFDKIAREAIGRRLLTLIPAGRGYYVSIRFATDELKEAVMERMEKHQINRTETAEAGKDIMTFRKHLLKRK
jgi:hypothetical protein